MDAVKLIICSACTELLYVKIRYIQSLIPITFSYLKPFLFASYLGWFCPAKPQISADLPSLTCYPQEYLRIVFACRFCQCDTASRRLLNKVIHPHNQGCSSYFSKELSSHIQFLQHLELLFQSSAFEGLHELSYSSVQFHQPILGLAETMLF